MEAEAECMFIGISNSLDVIPRVACLERDVTSVTSANSSDDFAKFWKRNQQRCSALLKIFGDLRHVYQHHDQREQESDLLCAVRDWQRIGFISGNREWINSFLTWRWFKGTGRCALSVLWGYLNFLVGSGRNLLLASTVLIFLFAGFYDLLVTKTVSEHEMFQQWQDNQPLTSRPTRPRPRLLIANTIGDLRFDYFSYWLPQSAATFVGMHQYLEGGLHRKRPEFPS
jgi:hypothetical protein